MKNSINVEYTFAEVFNKLTANKQFSKKTPLKIYFYSKYTSNEKKM